MAIAPYWRTGERVIHGAAEIEGNTYYFNKFDANNVDQVSYLMNLQVGDQISITLSSKSHSCRIRKAPREDSKHISIELDGVPEPPEHEIYGDHLTIDGVNDQAECRWPCIELTGICRKSEYRTLPQHPQQETRQLSEEERRGPFIGGDFVRVTDPNPDVNMRIVVRLTQYRVGGWDYETPNGIVTGPDSATSMTIATEADWEAAKASKNWELPVWLKPCIVFLLLMTYGMAPINLMFASKSTCKSGTPMLSYGLVAASVSASIATDYSIWHMGRNLAHVFMIERDDPAHFVSFAWERQQYLTILTKQLLHLKDFCSGKLEVLDLQTDFLQPGQVRACEEEHPHTKDDYGASWQHVPLVGKELSKLRLSTATLLICLLAYASQICLNFYSVCKMFNGKRTEALAACSTILGSCGAATSCDLMNTASFYSGIADVTGHEPAFNDMTSKEGAEQKAINTLKTSITRCLLEACPSLDLTIAFVAVFQFDAGRLMKAKLMFSLVLNLLTISMVAQKIYSAASWQRPSDGSRQTHNYTNACYAVAVFLVLFSAAMAVKLYGVIICGGTHLFNVSEWRCSE
eukprot:TRINITY_DN76998_c0_g1_i1.p1 TRINITY_DN76998_c0_g1~~TRINITY_DN76998_c0_g1_i1.p1  ORF type:complete len:575 (+),score=55.50 TRINITY_DN76998_c0_g1_i1:153-1877(+)